MFRNGCQYVPSYPPTYSEPPIDTFGGGHRYVRNVVSIRSEVPIDRFRSGRRYVPKRSSIGSGRIEGCLGTYRWVSRNRVRIGSERITPPLRNVSPPRSERIDGYFRTYPNTSRTYLNTFRTYLNTSRSGHRYVLNLSPLRSEPIDTTFRTYRHYVRNLSPLRPEPTIPLKSRSPDVKVSGLIVRRKGVDMLPVASSVKGRKVRIRARVRLPNRYPVWW